MIVSMEHQSNLKSANFLMGFEKFAFKNSDKKEVKSIAMSLDEENINLGSLDSTNLEFLQLSYIIVKESVSCSLGEIVTYNSQEKKLECSRCSP